MALLVEVVGYGGEFLERLHSSKPQHRPLSSSERQVAVFRPIVLPSAHLAAVEIAKLPHRRRVGSQPVGNDCLRPAVAVQRLLQKSQSRGFILRFFVTKDSRISPS